MIQLECTYKITTIGLMKMKKDKLLRQVDHHKKSKKLYSVQKEATSFKKDIQIQDTETGENESATQIARHSKECANKRIVETISENWKAKPMHGPYPERVNKSDIDKESTYKWLKISSLKGETEGFIIAAQDQNLSTNNYRNKIIKDGTNHK